MWWPARFRKTEFRRVGMRSVTEIMEPRILYSADIAGGLMLASGQPAVAEQRTLDASGEYKTPSVPASVATATVAPAAPLAVVRNAQTVAVAYAAAALSFETNAGQASAKVDFVAQGSGYDISLSGGSVELRLARGGATATVQLGFDGGNGDRPADAQGLLAAQSNYLVGNDSAAWRTGIANYGAVAYHNVYDGIDVSYYGTQRQLEYDFLVAPGANADQIRLRFTGAQASVDAGGDLILAIDGMAETLRFKAPVSYQDSPLGRQGVASSYQLNADGSIGFSLGEYDHARLLVIDPVLSYASYFGGTGNEAALGVAVDSTGAVYITGRTTSALGSLIGAGGSGDVYVAKFSADLTTLIYSTRIGGTGDEQGNSIAVDSSGNASVTGWTQSSNFPTVAASQATLSGSQDAFVFRLNAAGSGLAFSTFLGGLSATDQGTGIAVDTAGNVYATGQRSQALVPVLTGLGGSVLTGDEAFAIKYDTSGAVQYSQFFGGTGTDAGVAITVDTSGNAYIVGQSDSGNLPMVNANDTVTQLDEGFIAKINAAGNSLLYSSFIGGNKKDFVTAVAVDASGKAYVTGTTEGKNNAQFQVTSGAFQTSNSGVKQSGFLRVYDTGLSGAASLLYSSFLGGVTATGPGNGDRPTGIGIDASGRAVIVGRTDTSDFPVTADAYSSTNTSSGADGATFLVVLNPAGGGSGDLVYGTFFGQASATGSVAVSGGKAVFVGATSTTGLSTAGVAQPSLAGGTDAVVVSFTLVPNTAPVIAVANGLASVLEDPALNPGTLVSTLIAGKITDPDAGAVAGIAVTGLVTTNGAWQYSLNNGTTWTAFGAPSSAAATLLASDTLTRVRFVPNLDFAGTVSAGLSFRAWDRTSGTNGGTASTTSNGGTTAFSSGIVSAGIAVTPVNDAPVRSAGTVVNLTVAEDSGLTSLGLGSLAYGPGGGTDEAGQTISYTVSAVPAASVGSIVLADGTTAVSAASSYSLAQLQGMQFRTAANANGGPFTYSWSVMDSGGTANGGVDTLTQSLTITVTPVNDAPVGTSSTVTKLEDTAHTFAAADFGFSDPSDAPANALLAVKITTLPAAGSLTLSGMAVTAGQFVSASNISAGKLVFAPVANANGNGYVSINFQVQDDGGTTNSGIDLDPTVRSWTLNVTPVNDAPVRSAGTVANLTVLEDSGLTSLGLGSLAYGPGGGTDEAGQIISYSVTAVPAASLGDIVLANGGTVVSAASSYSLAQLQGMQFRAAANANGGPAIFSWSVTDSGGTANGGVNTLAQSLTVTVTAAPVTVPAPTPTPTPVATPTPSATSATLPITDAQIVLPPSVQSLPVAALIAAVPVPVAVPVVAARSDPATGSGAGGAQADGGSGDVPSTVIARGTSEISATAAVQLSPVSFVSAERRDAVLSPQVIAEPEFSLFNLQAGVLGLSPQEGERTLRSPVFLEQMDRMREDIRKELNLDSTVAISAAGATLGGSVIYLLWLIRGGVLMGSYLSALPAWQVLDPLPVLERLKDPTQDDDDLPDDLSDHADDPLQSLRGY